MKSYNSVHLSSDSKSRSCLCSLLVTMSLICGAYFICSAWRGNEFFSLQVAPKTDMEVNVTEENEPIKRCNDKCRPTGSEALPRGIVSVTSNLDMVSLAGPLSDDNKSKKTSLLAIAAGINQKVLVNEIVNKFLRENFVVMLFHYDGIVNEWSDFEWNDRVIHVTAKNQTKWWFAKRFLHPDIVSEYEYIFLWDEDLGVENFHPGRYVSIIKEEGLEISQPGLDLGKSEVHHHITVRHHGSTVHRRYYKIGTCDSNSTDPPCVGWVEMMAPVFSKAAWRCVWYMIQNDLIHAWGLDMQLGYCAQASSLSTRELRGDRTVKVGVVDEQYIVHHGLPTLGDHSTKTNIRLRSYIEMTAFRNRWNKAIREDECWVDPFRKISE
ncbi:Protein of unknown function (DUF707 [Striga hermonthica]|uniref:Uncharacterized protein n=1 Tax=Striga hermonthica TaxID=68872 RepID=A0A9N7NXI7_STRHE|nr:Protein of unknown function (DUF707 [Striga hermonthica]